MVKVALIWLFGHRLLEWVFRCLRMGLLYELCRGAGSIEGVQFTCMLCDDFVKHYLRGVTGDGTCEMIMREEAKEEE